MGAVVQWGKGGGWMAFSILCIVVSLIYSDYSIDLIPWPQWDLWKKQTQAKHLVHLYNVDRLLSYMYLSSLKKCKQFSFQVIAKTNKKLPQFSVCILHLPVHFFLSALDFSPGGLYPVLLPV